MTSRKLVFVFPLLLVTACSAQTSYYSSKWLDKEVPQNKGKFSKNISNNSDGSVTTEVKIVRKDEVIKSETYKGEEPFGVWIYVEKTGTKVLDYDFAMTYADVTCSDSLLPKDFTDYFKDDPALGYSAPEFADSTITLEQFSRQNVRYPDLAFDGGVQGTVYIVFTVTDKGEVENIVVQKGATIILDKEAVRVIRKLKFRSPSRLNGQPHSICVRMPFAFRLM